MPAVPWKKGGREGGREEGVGELFTPLVVKREGCRGRRSTAPAERAERHRREEKKDKGGREGGNEGRECVWVCHTSVAMTLLLSVGGLHLVPVHRVVVPQPEGRREGGRKGREGCQQEKERKR